MPTNPDTWLIAIVTLIGAVIGSATSAWFLGRVAGREFREAVIKEVAEVKIKADFLETRLNSLVIEDQQRDKELIELGKIAARLEEIVRMHTTMLAARQGQS